MCVCVCTYWNWCKCIKLSRFCNRDAIILHVSLCCEHIFEHVHIHALSCNIRNYVCAVYAHTHTLMLFSRIGNWAWIALLRLNGVCLQKQNAFWYYNGQRNHTKTFNLRVPANIGSWYECSTDFSTNLATCTKKAFFNISVRQNSESQMTLKTVGFTQILKVKKPIDGSNRM